MEKIVLGRVKVFGEEICHVDQGVNIGDCEFAVASAVADPMDLISMALDLFF
jgi:hypothetical protein